MILIIVSTLFTACYLIVVKPFAAEIVVQRLEVFNEVTLLFVWILVIAVKVNACDKTATA